MSTHGRRKENYYESHLTIEPVFEEDLAVVQALCKYHQFRTADLLMQRRAEDTPERSRFDTFCTGRSYDLMDLKLRTMHLVALLQDEGFKVWRYKIEETILDSRYFDVYNLLDQDTLPEKEANPRDPV